MCLLNTHLLSQEFKNITEKKAVVGKILEKIRAGKIHLHF